MEGEDENHVPKVRFGIESFSGISDLSNKLTVGVCTMENEAKDLTINDQDLEGNQWWKNLHIISPFKGDELELKNPKLLVKILSDNNYKIDLIKHIVSESVEYIENYKEVVRNYLKAIKNKTQ